MKQQKAIGHSCTRIYSEPVAGSWPLSHGCVHLWPSRAGICYKFRK